MKAKSVFSNLYIHAISSFCSIMLIDQLYVLEKHTQNTIYYYAYQGVFRYRQSMSLQKIYSLRLFYTCTSYCVYIQDCFPLFRPIVVAIDKLLLEIAKCNLNVRRAVRYRLYPEFDKLTRFEHLTEKNLESAFNWIKDNIPVANHKRRIAPHNCFVYVSTMFR